MEKNIFNAQTINVYVNIFDDPTYREITDEELEFLRTVRYHQPRRRKKAKGGKKGKK